MQRGQVVHEILHGLIEPSAIGGGIWRQLLQGENVVRLGEQVRVRRTRVVQKGLEHFLFCLARHNRLVVEAVLQLAEAVLRSVKVVLQLVEAVLRSVKVVLCCEYCTVEYNG